MCLAHPRAASVTVRIEKLDKEPGAVGVEIVRSKARRPDRGRTRASPPSLRQARHRSAAHRRQARRQRGALARASRLARCDRRGAAPIVVVPGEGPWPMRCAPASSVSASAMRRPTAWRCSPWISLPGRWRGCGKGFEVGATEDDLRAALERGSVAVWAPYALIAERRDIPESWRLTSDSLALWLAGRIGAERCYLIKSIARQQTALGAEQLARDGIVDAAFPACSRTPAFPPSCSAAATRRPSPPGRADKPLQRQIEQAHTLAIIAGSTGQPEPRARV